MRTPARTIRWWSPLAGLARIVIAQFVIVTTASAQTLDYDVLEQIFHEPVTASATGEPQRASDAPVNIEIITQDDIRRSGATNLPDVLQYVSGVDVRRYGVADAEVGIRGYNQSYNPRLLVMVDGRQVYSDDYGHVVWASIPVQLDEIRQIEVIKGPNSALYGFNAVGGVINIITFDPLRDKVNVATLRGGTPGSANGSVVGTAQLGDQAGLRLSAGGFRANDYPAGNLSPANAENRQSALIGALNLDTRVRLAPGVEAYAEATMGDNRYAEESFTGSFDTQYSRTNSLRVGLSADTSIGLLGINAYRNDELVSIGDQLPTFDGWGRESVYVLQASDTLKPGADHTLRFGLEYRNNAATSPLFIQGTIGYEVYAANAMWDWRITPRLSFTAAARVDDLHLRYAGTLAAGSGLTLADYNNAGFVVPSFNAGLVFRVTNQDTLRLMVARGVQVPSLIDFGLQFPLGVAGPVVVAGNPDLHPSIVDNVELDYDRTLPGIGSTLRAAAFAQRNTDLISQPLGAPLTISLGGLPLLLAANVGDSDAIGTEIGIKGHSASGFRWNASYAFVVTTNNTVLTQGPAATNPVDYATGAPRHVVTGGLGYNWRGLELDLMGRWQSGYRDFASNGLSIAVTPVNIDNYLSLTARAGYRLTDNVAVSLTAQQFNTPLLMQTSGPPVTRSLIGAVSVHY
jgi:outer membrane receptor for ferrienterochelin and colicins